MIHHGTGAVDHIDGLTCGADVNEPRYARTAGAYVFSRPPAVARGRDGFIDMAGIAVEAAIFAQTVLGAAGLAHRIGQSGKIMPGGGNLEQVAAAFAAYRAYHPYKAAGGAGGGQQYVAPDPFVLAALAGNRRGRDGVGCGYEAVADAVLLAVGMGIAVFVDAGGEVGGSRRRRDLRYSLCSWEERCS